MITQKMLLKSSESSGSGGSGSSGGSTTTNYNYVYLDIGAMGTLGEKSSYASVIDLDGFNETLDIPISVKKDCFIHSSYVGTIREENYTRVVHNSIGLIPIQAGKTYVFRYSNTGNGIVKSNAKDKIHIIPYLSGSKKIYLDFNSCLETGDKEQKAYEENGKIIDTTYKACDINKAVSAGYIKNNGTAGTTNGGKTVYNINFLVDCVINAEGIYFTSDFDYRKGLDCYFLPIKSGTTLKICGIKQIIKLTTSSFKPNIDFSSFCELLEESDTISYNITSTTTNVNNIKITPLTDKVVLLNVIATPLQVLAIPFAPIKKAITLYRDVTKASGANYNCVFSYK